MPEIYDHNPESIPGSSDYEDLLGRIPPQDDSIPLEVRENIKVMSKNFANQVAEFDKPQQIWPNAFHTFLAGILLSSCVWSCLALGSWGIGMGCFAAMFAVLITGFIDWSD